MESKSSRTVIDRDDAFFVRSGHGVGLLGFLKKLDRDVLMRNDAQSGRSRGAVSVSPTVNKVDHGSFGYAFGEGTVDRAA